MSDREGSALQCRDATSPHRIRLPIDAGRKIDPVFGAPAEALQSEIEISTMLAHWLLRHAKAKIASATASKTIART